MSPCLLLIDLRDHPLRNSTGGTLKFKAWRISRVPAFSGGVDESLPAPH